MMERRLQSASLIRVVRSFVEKRFTAKPQRPQRDAKEERVSEGEG
jgi:hypothetical protein